MKTPPDSARIGTCIRPRAPSCWPRAAAALTALGATVLFGGVASAAAPKIPKVTVGIERCVPAVLAKYPGDVLQVVLKPESGQPVWEIEVEARDGRLYDVECSGRTGKLVETEERFKSADAPAFKAKAKVSEADARAKALAKHPGTVESVEFEIEADGAAVYEYDIQLADGSDIRVEVDASTGELHEAHAELIEIGRLPM